MYGAFANHTQQNWNLILTDHINRSNINKWQKLQINNPHPWYWFYQSTKFYQTPQPNSVAWHSVLYSDGRATLKRKENWRSNMKNSIRLQQKIPLCKPTISFFCMIRFKTCIKLWQPTLGSYQKQQHYQHTAFLNDMLR